MQYNHILSVKKVRKPLLSILVKTLVFLLAAFYILYVVRFREKITVDFIDSIIHLYYKFKFLLIIPVLLFFVNWALEALKWKYSIKKIETISFLRSFRGVLTGVTLGFATPFNLGDYAGRILQLNDHERAKAIGAVFVNRIAQFYMTLLFGSFSFYYILHNIDPGSSNDDLFTYELKVLLIGLNLIFALLLVFHKRIIIVIRQIPVLQKIYPYLQIIGNYSKRELLYLFTLSFIRYLVFSSQFLILLYLFEVSTDILLLFVGVNFIFFMKSVVPTFFDFGVRESAAIYFFTLVNGGAQNALFASVSLWFINILIPALIGLFLIFRIKLFTNA